jgi:uncharacterized protein (DUF2267 family)
MADQGITPEARRLLEACDLHEVGLEMMRQRLRREHPGDDEAAIESLLRAWISDRPYDSPGRPVVWPRA